MVNTLELAVALCDDVVESSEARPVAAWHWGPALLGFALGELEDHLGVPRYRDWLTRYGEHWLSHRPPVHSADTVAPALVTWHLQRTTGDPRYAALTDRVVDYIEHQPRLVGDAVNHLGTSGWGRVYPRSIWVDSLMMFSVFPARYGAAEGRANLVDIAARQPRQYAELMFDADDGLWYHSWWAPSWHHPKGGAYPGRDIFWARGNGWVVAALPMILDAIGPDHPEAPAIRSLLRRTSAALVECESPDRTWSTLLTSPRRSYRELSASALVAGGWLHAGRRGHLDESYLHRGHLSLQAVARQLRRVDGRWQLPEISGPTVPVPFLPELGYRAVRAGANHPYGVAAFVLAAINDDLAR